ncbi:putative baseplate assembly protein [Chitinimonas arctica]|uniref:Putative baseplate assembly protein n=1 Tax=Chitinimonas arctica TaxID=2594795 RepID=A0A516SIY0_9NEIS|nr:putative baseplate assembly protein [Chitinimonas arctica]QDQ27998.1 putative baseplate assembly protein [Chitinimonas arctica]
MTDPTLDFRNAEQFYQQALTLARAYTPGWSNYWPSVLDAQAVNDDPGLVQLKLFSLLAAYLAEMENQLPRQRRLAFFQFLNLNLRPPLAARVPIHFTLQADQPPREIPTDSAILASDDQSIRFQTDQPLLVVPAQLSAVLTMLPAQDSYINALPRLAAGLPAPLFPSQDSEQGQVPLSHWFMLGDPDLFKPDPSLQRIVLEFTGQHLNPAYFDRWADGALAPLAASVTAANNALSLTVELEQAPTAGPLTTAELQAELYQADGRVQGFDADQAAAGDQTPQYWLLVQPAPLVRVISALASQLPVITGLRCTLQGSGIQPQQSASAQVQLDIRNGAYPFGETPATDDAFYIRSDSLFGREGAQITLDFTLRDVSTAYPVTLDWQYWDGGAWQSFNATPADVSAHRFVDTTDQLRYNNPAGPTWVRFLCPAISPTTVAGGEGLWIRVVIASGGYGEIGGITTQGVDQAIDAVPDDILTAAQKKAVSDYLNKVEGVNFSYTYTASSYAPPYIKSLQLSYSYAAQPKNLWCYNAFGLSRFLFSPFKPLADRYSNCCLGFAPADFAKYTLGQALTLYFDLVDESTAAAPPLPWQYHDGSAWQPLSVDDGTAGLSRSGIVRLIVPANQPAVTLYSQTAFWFRLQNPYPRQDVAAYGIYPNTVTAGNRSSVVDEILGSSNEQPSQHFQLGYTPVLAGLALVVVEPPGVEALGSADGEQGLLSLSAATPLPSRAAAPVLWLQVETFAFSGPTDRVYTLDYKNGLITFGDGQNGMIPPGGFNNIVAASYQYTQGQQGNVVAGRLTVLRPGFDRIASVVNPTPARGGVDGDSVADLDRAAPAQIKANQRAVQLEDFDTLARAASPAVCLANAVLQADGRIVVAVLALSTVARPYGGPALLNQVADYLRARCLAPLASRIACIEPDYLPIAVVAQLTVDIPPDQRNALQQQLAAQLQAFFQPVNGGPGGLGWPFGEPVQAAQVSRFLHGQAGVVAIVSLALNGEVGQDIPLAPTQLPVAGEMTVLVYPMGG